MTVLTAIMAAAAGVDPLAPEGGFFNLSTMEGKVVLGAIVLVVLGLGIWGIYALLAPSKSHRHRRRRHRHHSHSDHEHETDDAPDTVDSSVDDEESSGDEESHSHGHRHRRRRRRREHRPRNPTLAETGGLPPIRTDAPPGP